MNKYDLIKKVVLRGNLNVKEVFVIVEVVMNVMVEVIFCEESVILVGFGIFFIKMCKVWNVLNLFIGENMVIFVRKVVKFILGYKMKLIDKE